MDKLTDTLREFLYINYIPLSKLFFRKYSYKVEVHLERYISKKQANSTFAQCPGRRGAYGVYVAEAACEDITGTYKKRRQGQFCSFYFENEEDALTFIEPNKPFITEIVAPMSDEERTALLDDATIRIRNTLFWGKYRWSVRLRWMKEEEWSGLKELVEGTYPTPEGQDTPRCTLEGGYPQRAYFNDHNDVLQFRIMAADNLVQIEQAVLREEISL
jgi:hypothetical protein